MRYQPSTPGLDRLDAMQRHPIGTFSALRRPSPVATQYKRQSEMYGQALRNLSRAARRGDAGAAINAIRLRDQANADGFTPGGIGDANTRPGEIQDREQSMMRSNATLQQANELDRRGASGLSWDSSNGPLPSPQSTQPTRISAALDMLEGERSRDFAGGATQYDRGKTAATALGVVDPENILSGDRDLKYRQTLDAALGQARTPEEIEALKKRGLANGITANAFDRRAKWWDSNR